MPEGSVKIFFTTSICLYLFSLIFHTVPVFSQLTIYYYILSISLILSAWVFTNRIKIWNTIGNNFKYLIPLTIFSIFSSFLLINSYPFVGLGDELRDGGLNAQEIATGQITDIFSYGRYESHGLFIPAITSIFYRVFGSSILTYRIPAAIISILDVLLFFILLRLVTKNKSVAFTGALTLLTLPLHLFYARTEIVVIFSSFFTTAILLLFYINRPKITSSIFNNALFGLILGISFNFHASIKAFSLVVILIYFLLNIRNLKKLALLFVFVLIGFGPTILNTQFKQVFLQSNKVPIIKQYKTNDIFTKYRKSLQIWYKEPTSSHYPDKKPIFNNLLYILFVLGILGSLVKKHPFSLVVFAIGILVHLTNSALTDAINNDHRLLPLLPIGAYFVSAGLAYLIKILKFKFLAFGFVIFTICYCLYGFSQFFANQSANKNRDFDQYLSMHTIYFIQNNPYLYSLNHLVINADKKYVEKMKLLHYQEQYRYFLPKINIQFIASASAKPNEVYLSDGSDPFGKTFVVTCENNSFYCPKNSKGDILIHY